MMDLIINFLASTQDHIFWVSAVLGTTFFVLRLLMLFFGGAVFEHHDSDLDSVGFHHDSLFFKCFTVHSMSGFLMIFGWSGLACSIQYGMSAGLSFIIALVSGSAMLVVTGLLMRAALSLEGGGSVFSAQKAVGLVGTVSQRIPAHGQGKVQLAINNVTRELLAQSHNKKPIQSFIVVKVVRVIDHEIVEVIELEEELF